MDLAARYEKATAHLDPPLAVVDTAAFDANAADLVRRAAGTPIRVASKSVRCRALLARVLGTPGFRGVLAYSLAEALWLWRTGTSEDIVVGYPSVDAAALRGLVAEPRARAAVTLMVDSTEQLDHVDRVLGAGHPRLRACLELDASWRPLRSRRLHVGTLRSPVHTARAAGALARDIATRPGFRLVGMMAYEGQIAGIGDADGGPRGYAIRAMQRGSAAEIARRRAAAVRAVRGVAELEFVNGGGTGSVHGTAAEAAVTEVAAGSGLLGPALFDGYRAFRPRPAALFALPVLRRPAPGVVTLGYGGYLASGPAGPSRVPVPYLPAGLRLVGVEGAGEVQTPVRGPAADGLAVGDRVWLRHAKAGELAERFTEYHLVDGRELADTVPTYRGEGRNFG